MLKNTGRGSDAVDFLIVAASRREMAGRRKSLAAYGDSDLEWRPFAPVRDDMIGSLAQSVAVDGGLVSDCRPLELDAVERLDASRTASKIVVMITDAWSVMFETQRR